MAKLSTSDRKKLSKSQFAIPEKEPDSGSYPIPDESHARNALARVSQHGTASERRRVYAAVKRKFPGIEIKKAEGGCVVPEGRMMEYNLAGEFD